MNITPDQLPFLCFTAGDDGTILSANDWLCSRLQYNKEELVGKNVDLIFTMATRIFQQTHFFPLLKMKGSAEEIFITLQDKAGAPLPVLINASRVVQDNNAVLTYVGIVVHNRKKFEDELVAAKKAAERALSENSELLRIKNDLQQHMERLDQQLMRVSRQNEEFRQFNHVITHNFQEPLRKLFIFTNLLESNSAASENIKKVKQVAAQMRTVLSGLQQYVWLMEAAKQPKLIDPVPMIEQLRQQLEMEHEGVAISFRLDNIPQVTADEAQLRLMLYQVLSNAVQFRKEGAPVQVDLTGGVSVQNRFRQLPGKYLFVEYWKLDITDYGQGFDPTYKQQVFELFRKLHPGNSAGVGLSLCKTVADNHDGMITIDSKKGVFTTVTIYLPLSGGDEGSGSIFATKESKPNA